MRLQAENTFRYGTCRRTSPTALTWIPPSSADDLVAAGRRPLGTWRNRITGSGEEAPDQLLANPANWRIHPKAQQDAIAGALDQVGWVQQVLVNRRTGFVVDGHARVAIALSRGERAVRSSR